MSFQPERTQLSAYLRGTTSLRFLDNTELSGAVAYDHGDLLTDALGLNLRPRKTWNSRIYPLIKNSRPVSGLTTKMALVRKR